MRLSPLPDGAGDSLLCKVIAASLLVVLLIWSARPALGQANYGEVRLKVTAPAGVPMKAVVDLICAGNGYSKSFATNDAGTVSAKRVPYGVYRVEVRLQGFALFSNTLAVRSALPIDEPIRLSIAALITNINVSEAGTLIDPNRAGSVMQIGTAQIEERVASLPGRSVQDLVNSQPGWLYEGNAVLHPRGSEYQTQFVIDGIPLTDSRSPSLGPEIEADDLDSLNIYTAGYPAEYGRKMGGVVEMNTRRPTGTGVHGQMVLSGGSYATASSYGQVQDVWGRNMLAATASGSMSSHYLNPVVPENYTNKGTTADFSTRYERDLNDRDRITLNARHELSRYLVPNELLQQQAGQIQNGDNFETMGTVSYQHIFSPDSLGTLAGMVRDNANHLYSNDDSTPIIAFQHNNFREGYFKGTFSLHHGNHELKAGVESDTTFLHENFNYTISDPGQFDANTPKALRLASHRPDLEQSAFVEDLLRLGDWTVSAGVRWDHYQLLLNENALSPRITIGRSVPKLTMVVHASYDRVFQTPSFKNILISSLPQINALSDQFLRLPVQPSRGNYFEGGVTQGLFNRMRVDVNTYRRDLRNFADDDQLLNTGVSYPIAFDKSVIYGAEGKVELVRAGRWSGFASYSYMVGKVWFPVTGGLFLVKDAGNGIAQLSGHFPATQDQRNSLRTRYRYRVGQRAWLAGGASYGSGLPFQFAGDRADVLAEYGPRVIRRINFDRGRILPQLTINASLGVDVYKKDKAQMRLQIDGDNLSNQLDVIDFGGLFSGNAIGPDRSFAVRLNTSF